MIICMQPHWLFSNYQIKQKYGISNWTVHPQCYWVEEKLGLIFLNSTFIVLAMLLKTAMGLSPNFASRFKPVQGD